ncbi:hypothetical protein I79_002072 [Cricetulus griseus]|uniref:Uncharacterized protein n=1 Tax=Cricetulus griseus TaxID=10029 RepID=G3GWF1_CRIGR|nr:hypothetical protein I79_002072 [Cricetulus griseus]
MATLTAATAMALEPSAQSPETLKVPFIHWTISLQSTSWLNHKISFHRLNPMCPIRDQRQQEQNCHTLVLILT